MSERVVTFYKLNDGVSAEEFATFSREVDRPACLAMPACLQFEVFTAAGGTGGFDRYIVEDINVTSWEEWAAATAHPSHAPIMARWRELADEASVVSLKVQQV